MCRGRSREDVGRGVGITPVAAAIVAAGGRGTRAGSDEPKQFRPLAGRALLRWSLDMLVDAGCSPIVVAVPGDALERARDVIGRDDAIVVEGGATRQASVYAALARVEADAVVVHDAARPFAAPDLTRRVLAALSEADAAVTAVPVDETLKLVEDDVVVRTIDRAGLYRVQTPQAFKTGPLRAAHDRARSEGVAATDDAELIETYGGTVAVVPGSRANIKVTFPEDHALAEAIARGAS